MNSHDHYDHLEMETIQHFRDDNITFIVPLRVSSHLKNGEFHQIKLLSWIGGRHW